MNKFRWRYSKVSVNANLATSFVVNIRTYECSYMHDLLKNFITDDNYKNIEMNFLSLRCFHGILLHILHICTRISFILEEVLAEFTAHVCIHVVSQDFRTPISTDFTE